MKQTAFKDHFSGHAQQYAAARPNYPVALFQWLAAQVKRSDLAWDVATGNGQAAHSLSKHFSRVHASDASANQIAAATAHSRINFVVEPAEHCSLPDACVDLVTVAQAAHWFNHEQFHREVRRVCSATGVIAIWCYELCTVDPSIDPIHLAYYNSLESYWPPERRYIESGYQSLPFPFAEPANVPQFELTCHWRASQFLGYLRSWSATQHCQRETGVDPSKQLEPALRHAWGDQVRSVCWPITLRLGRL